MHIATRATRNFIDSILVALRLQGAATVGCERLWVPLWEMRDYFILLPKEISKDFVVWGFFLRFARARFLLLGTPCGTREVSG